ncbi:outer membrane protein assembly factor BamE [Pseudoalteromonas xiamenensis]|uniref:Outer membrane protein assembly factor BamE n=1 Tax=Pseudoalteromonas xiamenensis TaxID=882626 RepID=A0A975DHK5_9GAMM|nr:outer membrane protein assembly factor BamE [Pseudoalteromonas xiamenensis]QTH71330.1 outer membrane protein assembly factor BamE [Pseudoalteromonas xiamenensis]
MLSYKTLLARLFSALLIVSLSGCANWVYRINIPQGNYLEQSDIDKLRINMTREQVLFVLGNPVAKDAFGNDSWHYAYTLNLGRDTEERQKLTVYFENDKLTKIEGDFETPKDFNVPLEK